ncbi:MAG: flagellar hook capping FlgD N-terminal domain-containing protein [Bradyrhizobium sp.]
MAVDATMAAPVTATQTATNSTSNTSSNTTIANNFQTFLTLLTTQLQNQNPLDPLDTNQFTQQLVQFASVEQQLRQNDQLATLVNLEKTAQSTAALAYVGYTAVVDGSKASFDGTNAATWTLKAPKDTTATITITNSAGQTVFSGHYAVQQGNQTFAWDGKGNDGTQWPAGSYTLNASGKDSSGNTVAIPSEVQGVVDSVDLTASPPLLSIGGQSYTTDQIKRVVRPGSSSS